MEETEADPADWHRKWLLQFLISVHSFTTPYRIGMDFCDYTKKNIIKTGICPQHKPKKGANSRDLIVWWQMFALLPPPFVRTAFNQLKHNGRRDDTRLNVDSLVTEDQH